MNATSVAPSTDRISDRLIREALDREVRSAAPLPVADAAVDLLYVLLAESLSVRGEEWTERGLSGDRLGSAEIRLKIRPAVH